MGSLHVSFPTQRAPEGKGLCLAVGWGCGSSRHRIHRQRRDPALNALAGVAECGPAWGWTPSKVLRAHKGSEQLLWGAAPAGMVQCRLQSQFWLNQTTPIAGAG